MGRDARIARALLRLCRLAPQQLFAEPLPTEQDRIRRSFDLAASQASCATLPSLGQNLLQPRQQLPVAGDLLAQPARVGAHASRHLAQPVPQAMCRRTNRHGAHTWASPDGRACLPCLAAAQSWGGFPAWAARHWQIPLPRGRCIIVVSRRPGKLTCPVQDGRRDRLGRGSRAQRGLPLLLAHGRRQRLIERDPGQAHQAQAVVRPIESQQLSCWPPPPAHAAGPLGAAGRVHGRRFLRLPPAHLRPAPLLR